VGNAKSAWNVTKCVDLFRGILTAERHEAVAIKLKHGYISISEKLFRIQHHDMHMHQYQKNIDQSTYTTSSTCPIRIPRTLSIRIHVHMYIHAYAQKM
jgi:hypothetical protein